MSTVSERATVEAHTARLIEVLRAAISSRAAEKAQLDQPGLVGRIVSKDVIAGMSLPGFDNSQMDGFAVRAADLTPDAEGRAALPLAGTIPAGGEPKPLPAGSALAVMTGAPVPEGADVVIPVEKTVGQTFSALEVADVPESHRKHRFFGYNAPLIISTEQFAADPTAQERISETQASAAGGAHAASGMDFETGGEHPGMTSGTVQFAGLGPEDLQPGRFIRTAGSDITADEIIVHNGTALTPAHLGLLAACGHTEIELVTPTKALVLSTGDEVRTPGSELRPGQLYDANSPLIGAALETFGCAVETARVGTDDPSWFLDTLDTLVALHHPHIIVTAGGISKGAYEVVRQALEPRGISFGSVAQQPGGPQGWGLLDVESPGADVAPVAVIALPGNPVSCAVSLEVLVRPALAAIGSACPQPRRIPVRLSDPLSSPPGIRQYRRVCFTEGPDQHGFYPVTTMGGPSSHLLGHLARADALLELTEDDVELPAGAQREALLLTGRKIPHD